MRKRILASMGDARRVEHDLTIAASIPGAPCELPSVLPISPGGDERRRADQAIGPGSRPRPGELAARFGRR